MEEKVEENREEGRGSRGGKGEMMNVVEKEITVKRGASVLAGVLLGLVVLVIAFLGAIFMLIGENYLPGGLLLVFSILLLICLIITCCGFVVINPNEAVVLTLFGKYYGTIKEPGFYHINPFCSAINPAGRTSMVVNGNAVNAGSGEGGNEQQITIGNGSRKISTKIMTLNNEKQKVNDVLGNPVIIGAVVIWKVKEPTKAVFNVENYKRYLSIQCDSTIRNIARLYPYDVMDEDDEDQERAEKTLRGSSQEIAEGMTRELQERVKDAGLEILEVRITHLSYAEEIAAAMLQRQQAVAIIAARKKIVEGAVSMVKMAIDELGEEDIVVLDEERKAAMVSNLLVVLCGNKDAQPIVNSGSIY